MIYLHSNPGYSEKYIKFIQTPPIKSGKCFGLSIIWLTKCLESEVNNKDTEKYLKMNITDDFFWESFSMQRFELSLATFTLFESPKHKSTIRDRKFDFLSRMNNRNIARRQNNHRYELEFSLLTTEGKDILTEHFFNGVVTSSLFGVVIGVKDQNKGKTEHHAIALLQIKGKRYLFDPNLGVFNVTDCNNISSALVHMACLYMRSPVLKDAYYRINPHSEAIGVIPRFIT